MLYKYQRKLCEKFNAFEQKKNKPGLNLTLG